MFRTERTYIFKFQDREIERVEWDIEQGELEKIKGCLAFSWSCNCNDIEMEIKETYIHADLSETAFINSDGQFMHKSNEYACFAVMNGVRPAFDIEHEVLFYEFLDLITQKEFDKALIFANFGN